LQSKASLFWTILWKLSGVCALCLSRGQCHRGACQGYAGRAIPHRFKKRRDETIGEWRRGTASLRAPPDRRLAVEKFVVSGLLGMLLAQLVGPPRSADSGAVKRERRQRGLIDPKQPLRQPRFPTPAYLTEQAFPRPTRFWAAPRIGSVANEAYRSIVQLKISRYGVRRQQD